MAEGERAHFLPGTRSQQTVLYTLLALAAVLRFAPFSDLAYAHDELSALVRLHPTLAETVAKGVVGVDTHPPGVQVFLWAWTKLVGLDERWVKLPFMLASVGALLLLHRIAARLTDASVATVFTAVLATLQFTVLYGQLARPYAFGLFTTAWMAERSLAYLDLGRRRTLIPMALAAALSAYAHHLAALQALLIGGASLILMPATRRPAYFTACAAAVLAYLPNLPLLRAQLAWKGLDEWLPPPSWHWFVDHARFLAHWSIALGAVMLAVMVWSLVRGVMRRRPERKVLVLGLLGGLLPYLVTYAYSVWRAPVLQHSAVLFAFPYLLLLLMVGLHGLAFRTATLVAAVIACVATTTLVTTRLHYALNSSAQNRYEVIARGIIAANEAGITAVTDATEHMLRFHFDRWHVPVEQRAHIDLAGMDAHAVEDTLNGLRTDKVFLGTTLQAPAVRTLQVRRSFPFLLARHDMAEGQAFLLSARPTPQAITDELFRSMLTPQAIEGRGWTVDPRIAVVADSGNFLMPLRRWDFGAWEYGLSFAVRLDSLDHVGRPLIEATAEVAGTGPMDGARLVLEVVEDKRSVAYRTSGPMRSTQGTLAAATGTEGVQRPTRAFVEAYIWNEHRADLRIAAVQVVARRGNPVQYAWLGPVEGEWTYR